MRLTTNVDRGIIAKLINSPGFQNFIKTYNIAFTLFLGIITIIIIALFFVNVAKLSASAANEQQRKEAINGIIVCLVCFAIAGGIDTVYAILVSFVFGAA